MRKIISVILIFIFLIFLVSCDYPEKSFQALDKDDIPIEVTRDFILPKGIYAPFIWKSDNDALIIDGTNVKVNQKEVNVLVTLTATINQKSESFKVEVLKVGSERSWREKSEDALLSMKNNIP